MIAELNKWLTEQEATIAEEAPARRGSTLQAYSVGFGDAIRRLREWLSAHVGAPVGIGNAPVFARCRCGGVAAATTRTRPAPGVELVSTVCRCGRPISMRFEEYRAEDGTGICDGCGEGVEVIAGVAIAHPPTLPAGIRKRGAARYCAGSGRPPR